MERIYTLLQDIRKRPALYLGSRTFDGLDWFLAGYEAALNDIEGPHCIFNFMFQRFVEDKYRNKYEHRHWSKIIKEGKTDEETFDVFFELVDAFFSEITVIPPGGIRVFY